MSDTAEPGQELVPVAAGRVTLFRTESPREVIARATETANALAEVVKARGLIARVGPKEYPLVEAWTLCGTMLGVFPICVWTKQLQNGWEARVEARTLAGAIVGAAEAECLRSERNWASRDDFALKSMAQTRATSKALRLPLGFIMTLAGFEATPAEEMPTARAAPADRVAAMEDDLEMAMPTPPPSSAAVASAVASAPSDEIKKRRRQAHALLSKLIKAESAPQIDEEALSQGMIAEYGTARVADLTYPQLLNLIERLSAKEQELGL